MRGSDCKGKILRMLIKNRWINWARSGVKSIFAWYLYHPSHNKKLIQ
jgi:hypothetical protein